MQRILVENLVVGQLSTNCYIVIDQTTSKCFIIDPGDDPEYIIQFISEKKLDPQFIVATHGHFDHILAVNSLKLVFNIPFFLHKKDIFLVKHMVKSAKYFTGINAVYCPQVDGFLHDNQILPIGNNKFTVIEAPGHTPGSICLYDKDTQSLFPGDVIFSNGQRGRTDFSYSDEVKIEKSINQLLKMPFQTIVYPGHGIKTKISSEIKYYR
jgi:glyoxylase-like metal-dependent hydrolase (beta-lactamase superfamily II)